MQRILLCCTLIVAVVSAARASDEVSLPPPQADPGVIFKMRMDLFPRLHLGLEPFSGSGSFPWAADGAGDLGREDNSVSYGVRVGTFWQVTDDILVGFEIPYLAGRYSPAGLPSSASHQVATDQWDPYHNGELTLEVRF